MYDRSTSQLAEELAMRLRQANWNDSDTCEGVQNLLQAVSTDLQHLILDKTCGHDDLDIVLKWPTYMQQVCTTTYIRVSANQGERINANTFVAAGRLQWWHKCAR